MATKCTSITLRYNFVEKVDWTLPYRAAVKVALGQLFSSAAEVICFFV